MTFSPAAKSLLAATLPSGQVQTTTFVVDPRARRPLIGLKVEFRLPRDWAVEFNALHRELKSTTTDVFSPPLEFPDGRIFQSFGPFDRTLTTWEFPVLAKYRLPLRKLRPFLTAGPSFRPAGTGTGLSHAGVTAGGGAEFEVHGFRISPALRYTRWSSANAILFGSPLVNQVEFLVGLDRPSLSSGVRAFGKRLSIGAIAGIGLGQDFRAEGSTQVPEANSGIFGVAIEVPLTKNWEMEADGLYRPLHGSDLEFTRRVRFAHLTWEFPVMMKYRLPGGRLRPFLQGGPSFRAEGNLNLRSASHYGASVGAGLETKLSWLKISPMVRYTRWGGQTTGPFSRTWANQTQLLVSFAY